MSKDIAKDVQYTTGKVNDKIIDKLGINKPWNVAQPDKTLHQEPPPNAVRTHAELEQAKAAHEDREHEKRTKEKQQEEARTKKAHADRADKEKRKVSTIPTSCHRPKV